MRFTPRASFLSSLLLAGIVLTGAGVAGHPAAAPAEDVPDLVTRVTVQADTITFHVTGKQAGIRMVAAGPEDWHLDTTFPADATPTLSVTAKDVDGRPMPDGLYSVELMAAPIIPRKLRARLQDARERGEKRAVRQALRKAGVSLEPRTHHQSFSVIDGKFLDPGRPEPQPEPETGETPPPTACRDCGPPAPVATLARLGSPAPWSFDAALRGDLLLVDQVFHDDVIISASLCVGVDCVNGESFGYDTIRLKENNLRIKFDDTSSTGSFPKNDWLIQANDSASGGGNFLAIQDVTSGRTVFRVNAGAHSNALFVDNDGDLGLGIANPLVELHLADGNTPIVRLEQTQVSGWTPQTWDVGSNEANFFIRDVTHNGSLPFRIRPGAPKNALYIANSGKIGLRTESPVAELQIKEVNPTIRLENSDTAQQWDVTGGYEAGDQYAVRDVTAGTYPLVVEKTAPTDTLRIKPTKVTVGQDLEVAAGKGVLLGGTAPANKVDHYETGTWTPTFTGSGGGTPTYAANGRRGTYQRVGNWVTLQGRIQLTSLTGFSGTAQIGGLPFPPQSVTNFFYTGAIGQFTGWTGAYAGPPMAFIDDSGANVKVQYSKFAASGMADITPGASFSLAFTISYEI